MPNDSMSIFVRIGENDITKALSSRDIIKLLESAGWQRVRTVGDHVHFKHPTRTGKVTVTDPVKTIPIGTLRSIYRHAGLDWSKRS